MFLLNFEFLLRAKVVILPGMIDDLAFLTANAAIL